MLMSFHMLLRLLLSKCLFKAQLTADSWLTVGPKQASYTKAITIPIDRQFISTNSPWF